MMRASKRLLRLCWRAGLPCALAVCVGCADPEAVLESASQPVFGGQAATTCQYPSTVLLSGCTGTLVHPQVIVTAAHCGTTHRSVTFGEGRTGRKVAVTGCRRVGNGRDAAADYAFCTLATPVTDVPIAPILMGCELDVLKPGRPIVGVGFGDADDRGTGFGTKRWVETVFNRLQRGAANVGGKGKGYCYGDSGGPAYVKLDDGSWRVFGIVSEGLGASCGAGDLLALMSTAVPWIEKTSGIDITPCHDADGKWNPGPNCRGFSLNPAAPGRAWAQGCAEPTLSPPAATCGPAYAGPGPSESDAGANDAATPADASVDAAAPTGSGGQTGQTGTGGTPGDSRSSAASGSGGSGGPPGSRSPDAGRTPATQDPLPPRKTGGCSATGGAPMEESTALVAIIAFTLAYVLRRRWFAREN